MNDSDSISLYRTRGSILQRLNVCNVDANKTQESLLLRLKDHSEEASWNEFYSIYGRMIYGFALNFRLSHSEAEDIVQEVCVKVSRRIINFNYSSERGHFRSWLKTITKHAVIDYIRRQDSRRNTSAKYQEYAEVLMNERESESDALWQREWEKTLIDVALQRVYERISERCQKAFKLFALGQMSADEVGRDLDMEPNTVYACKHRVIQYLREEVEVLKKECKELE